MTVFSYSFLLKVAKMSARNKKLEDEVSTDLSTVAWSTKMLEALFLLVSYFFIATFDDCVFLLFFVQVDKMSPRNKKLEDEVSKDLSNEDWSKTILKVLFSALRIFW